MENEILTGQQATWTLIKKMGEGDAGEVYRVETLAGTRAGVLKRPQKSAFTGDVLRQAAQIKNEGLILKALSSLNAPGDLPIKVPELLDQSKPGSDYGDRFFIVQETAPGCDLAYLARLSHMGLPEPDADEPRQSLALSMFFNSIAENGRIPDRILLTCLSALLELLHRIHLKPGEVGGAPIEGYIYNDVKPEHLFWDPEHASVTLIDWGNAQLTVSGGQSRDRQYSTRDDYHQFVEGMGKFLASSAPELALRLDWPSFNFGPFDPDQDLFQPGGLGERIHAALAEENEHLAQAHARQDTLLQPGYASPDAFLQLQAIHKELLALGEIPDFSRVSQLACGYAARLAALGDLASLRELSEWAVNLPGDQAALWRLVARLTQISLRSQGEQRQALLDALQAAVRSQGEEVIWQMVSALQNAPEPNWWPEVVSQVRLMQPGFADDGLLPSTAVNRLALALQSQVRQEEDRRARQAVRSPFENHRTGAEAPYKPSRANYGPRRFPGLADAPTAINEPPQPDLEPGTEAPSAEAAAENRSVLPGENLAAGEGPVTGENVPQPEDDLARWQAINRSLQEDILGGWWLVDPHPPHAALDYEDLDRLLDALAELLPVETELVSRRLDLPRAQVERVLAAWDHKDFVAASQGLRAVLLHDPDRRRVLRADQLILSAPAWLNKVHLGLQQTETFKEFTTDLEFEGRELRNHVGPASWLDAILDCLASLRKGVWPSDLLLAHPGLERELPWLKHFERIERLPAEVKTAEDELPPVETPPILDFSKKRPGRILFGPEGELRLLEPLDAWLPEVRGSSARVYLGEEKLRKDATRQIAVKLMRMDKIDYALPLFREEAQILALMDGVPGVVPMLESGFINFEPIAPLPPDSDLKAVRALQGELVRFRPSGTPAFLEQLDTRVKEGWTPYLGIEKLEREDNLLYSCDAGMTHGHFLPMVNLLQMAVQVCDIVQVAHSRNVVYRDHKLLHYYWQARSNGIFILDWNVARLRPDGLSDYEKQMDLVQFGARGLHHILTGRSAPGALPLGPTRPEEIEQAAQTYRTQWTYDDERLPTRLRDIIEAVLSGAYSRFDALRDDLKGTFITL